MRKFDTNVQYTKYLVLREVAREAWADTLLDNAADIPQRIAPNGSQATDCCVYKERAVLAERVRMAAGATGIIPILSRSSTWPAMNAPWAALK